jgi:acetyltransferase (GNAT) family protein
VELAREEALGELTVEIFAADGPLDERMLAWVADLYGGVDPKYRRHDFLEHLLVRGPGGPSLHGFAVDDGTPVGHAAVVPTPARRGAKRLRAGKLEALVVAESHRGRRDGNASVAEALLHQLYARADENGIELIHAHVAPQVGRVIGFTRLDGVGRPSLVALLGTRAQLAERALAGLQLGVRKAAHAAARSFGSATTVVRELAPDDADLLETPEVPRDSWAVVADDAFGWYATSPYIRVLEVGGDDHSRALIQLPGSPQEPLRVASWQAPKPGTKAAAHFLSEAARLAQESGASALRLQQGRWNPTLDRTARALGFVRRHDLTTLWVRARDPSLARADAVVATPMLYLGF